MLSIWAVACNTLKQALRMKVALIFILLLLILLPLMGTAMSGDGTIKGRLQTFISYGLSLTSFLLCILTIFVSAYTVTSDIKDKQIFTVVTKPIRRWQIICGKLLGVIILNAVLLVVFSSIIFGITRYIPAYYKASDRELAQLKSEFFTARASVKPPFEDVSKEVEQTYRELEESGQLDDLFANMNKEQIKNIIGLRRQIWKRSAEVGKELVWKFNNVRIDPGESLFVKFKYDVSVNPADLNVYGRWEIGDHRQLEYGSIVRTPFYRADRKDLIRTLHEMEVPGDCVADDGYVELRFVNLPLNNTVVIFPPGDIELLYRTDTFSANYLRAVMLIFGKLIFLTCMGTLAGSFLSFPVAILMGMAVFLVGTASGFIIDSFSTMSQTYSVIYFYSLRYVIELLPRFDQTNPTDFLVGGKLISWQLVGKVFGITVFFKAGLLVILGTFIFNRREIAKITV